MRRRALPALALAGVALAANPSASPFASPPAGPAGLAELDRRLLAAIEGEPVPVAASPALCTAAGAAPPAVRTGSWYHGSGACVLTWVPEPTALVTRATDGLREDLVGAGGEARAAALRDVFLALADRLAAGGIPAQARLLLQSTAWEAGQALEGARQGEENPVLRAASCAALRAVRAAAFTAEEAAALPDGLAALAEAAGAPEDGRLARDLALVVPTGKKATRQFNLDAVLVAPGLFELRPVPEAHARALGGRFAARVFFAPREGADPERLRRRLVEVPYERAGTAAYDLDGLEAVLLLRWNVLDRSLHILPTPQAAFWQQYTVTRRLLPGKNELEQADAVLRFLSIRQLRDLAAASPRYRRAPENGMARKSLIDAMPPAPGAPVTTLRGACLLCHRGLISSFHPAEARPIRLSPPLPSRPSTEPDRESLTSAFAREEEALQAWASSCDRYR